jgi:RNA polymerase sigma factor (sigma-70 family)
MPRILELMAEKTPGEFEAQDPLEQLLDEESDDEFGLPEFREHLADSLTPAVLKDWTAADFTSIYVRFRPHLERHAKRFLVNPSQVEEVVQDAFLYLMTTLPELDSELGVLKFLKWKTRLLALDVIRANSRVSFAPLDDQPEIAAKVDEFSLELERADDAAIVALALAKLQPRHREALIATLYEEKASEVVAAQMGLNENAFRQLLFRARSAFKKALVGEAETAGLRVSEILSIAARKAAKESGKYISAAGAFLLVLAISIGVLPNLSQPAQEQIAAPVPVVTSSEAPDSETSAGAAGGAQAGDASAADSENDGSNSDSFAQDSQNSNQAGSQAQLSSGLGNDPGSSEAAVATAAVVLTAPVSGSAAGAAESQERRVLESFMNQALDQSAVVMLTRNSTGTILQSSESPSGNLTLSNGSGLTAYLLYDLGSEQGIQHSWFSLEVGGNTFVAVPQAQASQVVRNADGSSTIHFVSTDMLVGDTKGDFDFITSETSAVSTGALRIQIEISSTGKVNKSTISLSPRT